MRRPARLIPAALAVACLAAAPAQAATRYASPGGSGPAADCSRADPCSLTEAVAGARDGDTVVPLPGTYPFGPAGLTPLSGVTIAGEAGQPPPRLIYSGTLVGLSLGINSVARNLYVEGNNVGSGRVVDAIGPGAAVEQSEVVGNGSTGVTVQLRDWGAIRSSVIRSNATVPFAAAIVTGGVGGTVHNVTAIASGTPPSSGISSPAAYGTSQAVSIVNTIADGNGGAAIAASDDAGADDVSVSVSHSNFPDSSAEPPDSRIAFTGPNQTAPSWPAPVLASPLTADFSQLPGSRTIDSGANGIGGPLDVEGERRTMGLRTDIGADEFPGTCGDRTATISGTSGPDTIEGTKGPDVFAGMGGNDTFRGRGGDDVACGGEGRDRLIGGGGNDRLFGEAGRDKLKGGPGKDRLTGGAGRDTLVGGKGADRLRGGAGRDLETQ